MNKVFKHPIDILRYMDFNFIYGWIDINNKYHVRELKQIKKLYKTMSLESIICNRIGTCIEQSEYIKYYLDKMNIPNQMYCLMTSNTDENIRMHCFVLYESDGYIYHIEHANFEEKGIHKYHSIDEALSYISKYFATKDGYDKIDIIKIDYIPGNLTFLELEKYIYSFKDKEKRLMLDY